MEPSNQPEAVRERLQGIHEAQVGMVESVVAEAPDRGEAAVTDTRAAARAVVAQPEGQVMFAEVYDDAARPGSLRGNRLALLNAPARSRARPPSEAKGRGGGPGRGQRRAVTAGCRGGPGRGRWGGAGARSR